MGKEKTTVHMFKPEDIVRSVLKGHKVTAPCGYVTAHTRELVDAIPDWIERGTVRFCADCYKAVNAMDGEITLHKSRGWLELLERVWEKQYDTARQATGTFPLAG